VTGASRGIGAAIALKFAQRGADVAINYVFSSTAADSIANEVRALGVRVITVKADVSNQAEVSAMFAAVKREFGRLDIVVSNSGIEHFGALGEVTGDDIDRIYAVNAKGQYFVAQEAYKYMEDFGRVMLTSSISAVKVRNCASVSPLYR
jgi:tetrahydroxynaphthalene reductase